MVGLLEKDSLLVNYDITGSYCTNILGGIVSNMRAHFLPVGYIFVPDSYRT